MWQRRFEARYVTRNVARLPASAAGDCCSCCGSAESWRARLSKSADRDTSRERYVWAVEEVAIELAARLCCTVVTVIIIKT